MSRTAESRKSDRLVPARHIGAIDRLHGNSLEGAVFRFVKPRACALSLTHDISGMARGHASNRLAELLPWNIQPDLAAAA